MKIYQKLLIATSLSLALTQFTAEASLLPDIFTANNNKSEEIPTLAPVLEKTIPAVVNISVTGNKEINNNFMGIPEEFGFFFRQMPKKEQRKFSAQGSGIIIDAKKGYVITNNHVIDDASKIKVTLHDGRIFDATIKGTDPSTDFALLELKDFSNLVEIKFANSDKLRVGDYAIAIGNPFGLGQTVTMGIVSALGRSGLNIENYENFIQTDAAINSGNSGGALINLKGELIGINTAILGKAGGNIGIGFAIPSNMAKSIIDQLITDGKVSRGMLGIIGSEVTEELAKNFDYPKTTGAFINEVLEDSAADEADLEPGDIITEIDDIEIKNFAQLRAKIATVGANKTVKLKIFRDGKYKTIKVKLTAPKDSKISDNDEDLVIFKGITLENNDDSKGLVVKNLDPKVPNKFRLKQGDVILEVNRTKTNSINDLRKAVSKTKNFISLYIKRGDSKIYITQNI